MIGRIVFNTNNPTSPVEHRAPTDDSIRLAEEMKDKAIQNILCAGVVENFLETRYVVYQEPSSFSAKIFISFKLNGVLYEHNWITPQESSTDREYCKEISEYIKSFLTNHITNDLVKNGILRDLRRSV